jgi:hypothetical protein
MWQSMLLGSLVAALGSAHGLSGLVLGCNHSPAGMVPQGICFTPGVWLASMALPP